MDKSKPTTHWYYAVPFYCGRNFEAVALGGALIRVTKPYAKHAYAEIKKKEMKGHTVPKTKKAIVEATDTWMCPLGDGRVLVVLFSRTE